MATRSVSGSEERALRLVSIESELVAAEQAELAPLLDEHEPYLPIAGTTPYYRTLTIIVPVYNERNTVLRLLEKVCMADTSALAKEIFVVDDCSTDGTRELLQEVDWENVCPDSRDSIELLLHERNCGKGACILTS